MQFFISAFIATVFYNAGLAFSFVFYKNYGSYFELQRLKYITTFITNIFSFFGFVAASIKFGPGPSELFRRYLFFDKKPIYIAASCLIIMSLEIILYCFFIKTDRFINQNFINIILYAASYCLLAPVGEEIYFRFVLWRIFNRYFSEIMTSILTLSIWSLLHYNGNISTVFGIIPLGLVLTYIRRKTNNIAICIIVHSWNNTAFLLIAVLY